MSQADVSQVHNMFSKAVEAQLARVEAFYAQLAEAETKALEQSKTARMPRAYWDWQSMLAANESGFFTYTPSTNLLYGLRESLQMLKEEGLQNVFARHTRLAEATRRAVAAWGLELCAVCPEEYSNTVTTVLLPTGHDADRLRGLILDRFNMSLGTGLGRLKGRAFRLGHLGDFNELMLMGMLSGVEMGLSLAGVPFTRGGVDAAMKYLESEQGRPTAEQAARTF